MERIYVAIQQHYRKRFRPERASLTYEQIQKVDYRIRLINHAHMTAFLQGFSRAVIVDQVR